MVQGDRRRWCSTLRIFAQGLQVITDKGVDLVRALKGDGLVQVMVGAFMLW